MENKKAELLLRGKKFTCRSNIPVWKAMKENNISVSSHLIIRSGRLITDDEIIKAGEELELIPVISGG